ncbi:MAG: hypothetical protein V1701_06165 [Planctomycetota bacterium]
MIKDGKLLKSFEDAQIRQSRLTRSQSFRIAESLWRESKALCVSPSGNSLEGLETEIRIARILNRCSSRSS